MIQLEPRHQAIIKAIFSKFSNEVFVFGSRSKGTAKPLSDLDVAIFSEISKADLVRLKAELEDSNLPFHVDVIVWDEISPEFQNHIKPDLKRL